jgi:SAM-dependent methyltransferase
VRELGLRALARLHLLRPAYAVYERARALRASRRASLVTADDGLPMPPPRLIVRVAGSSDPGWFLESGRRAAASVRELLARCGVAVDDLGSILDFGCGCGRVTRTWRDFRGSVSGSDRDREAVDWSRERLPFAHFELNGLTPPLAFDDDSFDLVYALSVFTHLTEDLQRAWIRELHRVLRPGGYLVVSTHGEAYLPRLTPRERERFRDGELVVRWPQAAGTNLCGAYHPEAWLRSRLAHGFDVLAFETEGARGNPQQDLSLLRRMPA